MKPPIRASEPSKQERKALTHLAERRKSLEEVAYLDECRRLCVTEGLKMNSVRSVVWRDIVLGLGALQCVPEVNESIARRSPSKESKGNKPSEPEPEPVPDKADRSPKKDHVDLDDVDRANSHSNSSDNHSGDHAPVDGNVDVDETSGPAAEADPTSTATNDHRHPSSTDSPSNGSAASRAGSSPLLEDVSDGFVFPENCQPRVIDVDVERSLWTLYHDPDERAAMRVVLKSILLRVLAGNAERHYYQGLHELVGFVMYVMLPSAPMEAVVAVCERLLRTKWRSFSDARLSQSQSMLYAAHAVVAREDAPLAAALEACGVAPESHYAVAWLITWFTHTCDDTATLARLFDHFVSGPDEHGVVFVIAALVLHERGRIRESIRAAQREAEAADGELMVMARVYTDLTRLPRDVLTADGAVVEDVIAAAEELRAAHADAVWAARADFLQGRVTRLGMLADARTRNLALRLLWGLLFREWRTPWNGGNVKWPFVAAAAAVAVAVAAYVAAHINLTQLQ